MILKMPQRVTLDAAGDLQHRGKILLYRIVSDRQPSRGGKSHNY